MPKEAPRAPGKKLKIKLARDAGNSGPDLVSVRKIIEPSYQLPRAQQLSRRENQPCLGVPLISQLSCQPLEMPQPLGFCRPWWSLLIQVKFVPLLRKGKAPRKENE